MSRMLFVLLIVFTVRNFSQSFLSLDGIETPEGGTILLYHTGYPGYRDYTPVYKYNVRTGFEKKIMDAFIVNDSYTRSVQDFEFFPGDTSNFINCGFGYMPDNYGFVAYNDSSVFGFQETFIYVDISQQNPSRTYAGDNRMFYRSFDGGLTYPQDSVLDFHMISVSDFNDNEIFGIDDQKNLVKSFDGGHTSFIVHDIPVWEDPYFHAKLYYDKDRMHIYRINKSYESYNLYLSNNNGNSYSWELKSDYPHPFLFTNDTSVSGTCYLAYYYHLYKSTDYAESFTEYYQFDERIMGIYPKPGTQTIYAATKYHLYKLENDTLTTLKEIPPDPDLLNYYPLQVGNLWIYNGFIWTYPDWEAYHFVRKVNDLVLKPNQKSYFEVEEYFTDSPYSLKYYERIDSANAKVYRFDEDSAESGQEYLIEDLRAEVGDTVKNYRYHLTPYTVLYSADTTFFQVDSHFKRYYSESLMGYTYDLVKYFGITWVSNTFDFGSDDRRLKGAVINGTLYGDTTITGVKDEPDPVTSFSLFQNYPNPFNPATSIQYALGSRQYVTIKVYDALGNEVATLVNGEKAAGSYSVQFDGSKLSSGIYLYELKASNFIRIRKMVMLK